MYAAGDKVPVRGAVRTVQQQPPGAVLHTAAAAASRLVLIAVSWMARTAQRRPGHPSAPVPGGMSGTGAGAINSPITQPI